MKKIFIKHSIEYEIERILYSNKKIDWYSKNGYKIDRLSFPDALLPNRKNIKRHIISEYKVEDYEKNIIYLQKRWVQFEPELSSKIEKLSIKIPSKFNIIFTKYGVAGSYKNPNIIIVNIRNFWADGLLRNIIHELIHLVINPFIIRYKLDHWSKERIVYLIILNLFPQLNKIQTVPINTYKIDDLFYMYFPDVKKIIIEVSKLA